MKMKKKSFVTIERMKMFSLLSILLYLQLCKMLHYTRYIRKYNNLKQNYDDWSRYGSLFTCLDI